MARLQCIISLFLLQSCLRFSVECLCCNSCKGHDQESSCVSLPQYTPGKCQIKRYLDLQKEQKIYKLTKPSTTPSTEGIAMPTQDIKDILSCPLLNLTIKQVVGLALMDPNQQLWFKLFKYISMRNEKFVDKYKANFTIYEDISDYIDIYEKALAFQVVNPTLGKYFQYPSTVEPFKDIIRTGDWEDDNVFTEQRLAGLNVHSIQGVYLRKGKNTGGISLRKLRRKLNGNFDWNGAFSKVVGRRVTMTNMVRSGSVFVVLFSIMKGLKNIPDVVPDPRVLKHSTSPIAVFVSTKVGRFGRKPNTLKPVAIQIDETPDSPVYTPEDGSEWLMAKAAFQLADYAYLEMVEHVMKAHFLFESICVTLRRSLSHYHPLMQIMNHHCIGLHVTNSVGVPKLLGDNPGTMRTLFSMGDIGSIELVNRAYAKLSWDDYDFDQDMRKRGVLNKKKLPYYPYRDDGRVIYDFLNRFTNDYVNAYYRDNFDICGDGELQNFANELSRNGVGENGGIGMLRDFPSRIRSKEVLRKTLTRILWVVMRHHTVNYPVVYYGAFSPNMPSKLYDGNGVPDYEFSLKRLASSPLIAGQVGLGFSLASLRYDHLFDYSKKMDDKLGGCVVQGYYDELMSGMKDLIESRNRKRKEEGHLTYPYLQPGWIPNSIHT